MRDNTYLAVFIIIFTVLFLSLGDAFIKGISTNFTLWQIYTIRSSIVVGVLFLVIKFQQKVSFIPENFGWTLLRSTMLSFMWVFYYLALTKIELSIASAAYYTLPIFITLFTAYFLGNKIKVSGWIGIILGFLGVLLILNPTASNFNWFALLPLVSAVFYAFSMIITRTQCRKENVFLLSFWLNLIMLFLGLIMSFFLKVVNTQIIVLESQRFLLGTWAEMGHTEWVVISLLSLAIIIGSIGAAIAYQIGKPSTVATFDFGYVVFSSIWGWVLYQEIPSIKSILGIGLIVSAGILAIHSEKKV